MAGAGGGIQLGIDGLTWISELGSGGFGSVHRARDDAHGRDVAVKLLHASTDERSRERFNRERKLMGSVSSHPNVVSIYTSGFTEQGTPYLVMELIEGGSLGERITSGVLSARQTKEIGVALGEAMCVAHATGVLHLDIKPDNVLMGRRGEPQLADFGIASSVSEISLRQTISISPSFSPPEILNNAGVDARADIYSLAATLYSSLTGKLPYHQEDSGMLGTLNRLANDPVPRVTRPDVPAALANLLTESMAKEATARPPTMRAFTDRLATVDLAATPSAMNTPATQTIIAQLPASSEQTAAPENAAQDTTTSGAIAPDQPPTPPAPPQHVAAPPLPPAPPPGAAVASASSLPPAGPEEPKSNTRIYAAVAAIAVLLIAGGIFVATRNPSTDTVLENRDEPEPAVQIATAPVPTVAVATPGPTESPEPTVTPDPTTPPRPSPTPEPPATPQAVLGTERAEFTADPVRDFAWSLGIDEEVGLPTELVRWIAPGQQRVCTSWLLPGTTADTSFEINFLVDGVQSRENQSLGTTAQAGDRWWACFDTTNICNTCQLQAGALEVTFEFDDQDVFNESIMITDVRPQNVEITVVNDHAVPICRFEIAPPTTDFWGLNHLRQILPPGGSITFAILGGQLQTQSIDCEGNRISGSSVQGFDLTADTTITEG